MSIRKNCCNHCRKPNSKQQCSKCKMVCYCSREHQIKDYKNKHKLDCEDYTSMIKQVAGEKIKLEAAVPNAFTELNGTFYEIPQASLFLMFKGKSVIRCMRFETESSFEASLAICMEMMHLDRWQRSVYSD